MRGARTRSTRMSHLGADMGAGSFLHNQHGVLTISTNGYELVKLINSVILIQYKLN